MFKNMHVVMITIRVDLAISICPSIWVNPVSFATIWARELGCQI